MIYDDPMTPRAVLASASFHFPTGEGLSVWPVPYGQRAILWRSVDYFCVSVSRRAANDPHHDGA